jgi:RNA polymerase sigma-B factor
VNSSDAVVGGVTGRQPGGRGAEEDALFVEFRRTGSRRLRNELVERHMGLAAHVARRFGRRGPSDDDLRQVAFLALVKAVDRFEPDRNVAFSTFAGRTIEGEIKRHFRDHTWTVRVPRSAKEIHLQLRRATDELTQRLGRSPTVPQLAEHLGIETDAVIEGIAAGSAYSTASLDAPTGNDGEGTRQLGGEDSGFGHVADVTLVEDLMAQLPPREREIVRLRFYEELSQSEIAERIGISQMHVSRLLRRSFEQMRGHGGGDDDIDIDV